MKNQSVTAINLLVRTLDGKNVIETKDGTKTLWSKLRKAGLVTRVVNEDPDPSCYPFFFSITDAGRKAIREAKQRKAEGISKKN